MNLKQSVQIGAIALSAAACGEAEKPKTPGCEQAVGDIIEGGLLTNVAGGVAARMSFKLNQAVDTCQEATALDPYYTGFKGNVAGQRLAEGNWDPQAEGDATTIDFASRFYSPVGKVHVAVGQGDTFTFPIAAGAFLDLPGETSVTGMAITDGEICVLTGNPGEPSDPDYVQNFEDTTLGCSPAKIMIGEASSSATGKEVPADDQQNDPQQEEEHVVTGSEVDPGDL